MDRRIARFNERITVQRCTVRMDRYGNHIAEWEDHFSCAAYASTYSREEKGDVVTVEERTVSFETRYCSELSGITSTGYRVVFHGDIYDIVSVDMMNYQRRTVRLVCRKERPSAQAPGTGVDGTDRVEGEN